MNKNIKEPILVYIINNLGFFISHRLPLAEAAIKEGFQVFLITGEPGSKVIDKHAQQELHNHNIKHIVLPFTSGGTNPFKEIKALYSLIIILKQLKPQIIHGASPKGVFYSSIANLFLNTNLLILSISGMGFLYTGKSQSIYMRLIKLIYKGIMFVGVNLKRTTIIVQNKDDYYSRKDLIKSKKSTITLVPGSGVDIEKFTNYKCDYNSNIILFPARILIDKGILDFVEASKILKAQGCDWRFVVVGTSDYQNPSAVDQEVIDQWVKDGLIEWWGHKTNMMDVYKQVSIVCLPSYREGLPKALLEAAAAGLPIVTTDAIGCREAIIPNNTGLIVPIKNPNELAKALEKLINDSELRLRFGREGKKLAEEKFALNLITSKIMNIYLEA